MPVVIKQNTLAGLSVKDGLRKQVVRLHPDASLDQAIDLMSKHKVNTVLVEDAALQPVGVVSKTDIMGAYYAELPIESPLEYIMSSPPVFCREDDLLETALDKMRTHKIHGLYVSGAAQGEVAGILAYADIVGTLYHYCHKCKLSKVNKRKVHDGESSIQRFKAKDVMSDHVVCVDANDSLTQVMEVLSAYRFGAVLVHDEKSTPCGTVSKTDLVFSYKRGIPQGQQVRNIMSTKVVSCEENDYLEYAIQQMILAEVQRLFIYQGSPNNISGVLSLSDTARIRSGSCHACVTSRIRVEKHG